MLKSIKIMLEAFESEHIEYCHWKSNEHLLPALAGDTDLDVLFLPEQRSKLERVLSDCGLKRFRATSLMQYNAIEDYIGFDQETAKIWHLHTHYRMTLGEKHLKGYTINPWGKIILGNRLFDNSGIYTSCPEDELVLLIVRNALKKSLFERKGNISEEERKEFTWLKERTNHDILIVHSKILIGDECTNELLKVIDRGFYKKRSLNKLKKLLRKQLKIFTGYNSFSSWIIRTKRTVYWGLGALKRHLNLNTNKPSRRVSPSGGTAVAFLGCDGAGKTTTIEYIKKEFSKKIDVKCIYLGSGDGSSSLIRKPMKLVAKIIGGKGVGHSVAKEYRENKKVSIKARLYSVAKYFWAMSLAKEKKKKLKQITKARNNGMLVLIDRYPQTEFPGYSDGPLLTRYLEKGKGFLYRRAIYEQSIYKMAELNPPDLVIKLMVPTDIAIQRKPEMTFEEIENKKKAVLSVLNNQTVRIIDTSVDKNTSFGLVMREIWEKI